MLLIQSAAYAVLSKKRDGGIAGANYPFLLGESAYRPLGLSVQLFLPKVPQISDLAIKCTFL